MVHWFLLELSLDCRSVTRFVSHQQHNKLFCVSRCHSYTYLYFCFSLFVHDERSLMCAKNWDLGRAIYWNFDIFICSHRTNYFSMLSFYEKYYNLILEIFSWFVVNIYRNAFSRSKNKSILYIICVRAKNIIHIDGCNTETQNLQHFEYKLL